MNSVERSIPRGPFEIAHRRLIKVDSTPLTKEDIEVLAEEYESMPAQEMNALFDAIEERFDVAMSEEDRQAEDCIYAKLLKHWLMSGGTRPAAGKRRR